MSGIIKGQSGQPIQFETKPNVNGDDVLTRPDIVGTVSESGGVPTGAIIQRGSNANGEFVRYADGTQICTLSITVTDQAIDTAYGSLYQSIRSWTFPVSFSSPPSVTCGKARWGTAANWSGVSATTSNTTTFRFWDTRSRALGTDMLIEAIAIGRWY